MPRWVLDEGYQGGSLCNVIGFQVVLDDFAEMRPRSQDVSSAR